MYNTILLYLLLLIHTSNATIVGPINDNPLCKILNVNYSEFVMDTNILFNVNIDFIPQIEKINNYAKMASVQVLLTSSFRRDTNITGIYHHSFMCFIR